MTDIREIMHGARGFMFGGSVVVAADPVEKTSAVRARFVKARDTFKSLTEKGREGIPQAVGAALDVIGIVVGELNGLVNHPGTLKSPVADEVASLWAELRNRSFALVAMVPESAIKKEGAALVGEVLAVFDIIETLIVKKLSLIHRSEIPDYSAGLDTAAVFPCYRYSASNRGNIGKFKDAPSGAEMWNTKIGGLIWPTAVVDAGGDLYTGHANGEFVALKCDGAIKWRIHDDQMMYIDSTGVLAKDGFLYMASTDCDPRGNQNQGRIWKIDPATGEVLWTFWGSHFEDPENNPAAHLSSFFEGNVSASDEGGKVFIYAGSDDNRLYKLDTDGSLVWCYDTDSYPSGVIWTKPLLSPDCSTVYIGTLSGQVHAVCTATGSRKWMSQVGGAVVSSIACGMSGELFFGCFDGRIYCAAPEDGTILWSYQTLGLIYSSPAVSTNGDVVIGSSDGGIYRIDRFGRRRWVYYTDAPIKSSPVIDPDDNAYIGNQNGKLYCINSRGKRVWSYHSNPGETDNDINSSPSLGADGTVYFGATTGEVFAIPPDYYYMKKDDPNIALAPGHDGKRPDIEPGGATIVFMDRYGNACFDSQRDLPITDNLNMIIIAVDDELNVIPATIAAGSLKVTVTPEIPFEARVESMGRFIYVMPEDFLAYDTEYYIRVTCTYKAEGRDKQLDATITIKTEQPSATKEFPMLSKGDKVDSFVLNGLTICQQKEIDALGQAMMESMKFAFAPIYIDGEAGVGAFVSSDVVFTGTSFDYPPKTVNKLIVAGKIRDDRFKTFGSMRLIAQGANIPVDKFRFAGRVLAGNVVENGIVGIQAAVSGVPDFEELIKVMNLADARNDVVGFCTFKSAVIDTWATSKPEGLEVATEVSANSVKASFSGTTLKQSEHYFNVVFIDTADGTIRGEGTYDIAESDGAVKSLVAAVPAGAVSGRTAAIFVTDLFPAAIVRL